MPQPMPLAQQFICKKCKSLSNVQTYERTREGTYFCVCQHCAAKNQVVRTGATPSQPGILPVTGLIQYRREALEPRLQVLGIEGHMERAGSRAARRQLAEKQPGVLLHLFQLLQQLGILHAEHVSKAPRRPQSLAGANRRHCFTTSGLSPGAPPSSRVRP